MFIKKLLLLILLFFNIHAANDPQFTKEEIKKFLTDTRNTNEAIDNYLTMLTPLGFEVLVDCFHEFKKCANSDISTYLLLSIPSTLEEKEWCEITKSIIKNQEARYEKVISFRKKLMEQGLSSIESTLRANEIFSNIHYYDQQKAAMVRAKNSSYMADEAVKHLCALFMKLKYTQKY